MDWECAVEMDEDVGKDEMKSVFSYPFLSLYMRSHEIVKWGRGEKNSDVFFMTD